MTLMLRRTIVRRANGPELATLDLYRDRTGVTIDVSRARLLHFASALSYWAWREADPDAHDRGSGRDRDVALAWVGLALFATRTALTRALQRAVDDEVALERDSAFRVRRAAPARSPA